MIQTVHQCISIINHTLLSTVRAVGSWLVNVSVNENSTNAHAHMRPT